nr:MAG TPA: methyltransferase domain protein [Caudoviricetes sp.]
MKEICAICGETVECRTTCRIVVCEACINRVLNERERLKRTGERAERCLICGGPMEHKRRLAVTCCDECHGIYKRIVCKLYQQTHSVEIAMRKSKWKRRRGNRIDEKAWKAKELGISYGMYVARERMSRHE